MRIASLFIIALVAFSITRGDCAWQCKKSLERIARLDSLIGEVLPVQKVLAQGNVWRRFKIKALVRKMNFEKGMTEKNVENFVDGLARQILGEPYRWRREFSESVLEQEQRIHRFNDAKTRTQKIILDELRRAGLLKDSTTLADFSEFLSRPMINWPLAIISNGLSLFHLANFSYFPAPTARLSKSPSRHVMMYEKFRNSFLNYFILILLIQGAPQVYEIHLDRENEAAEIAAQKYIEMSESTRALSKSFEELKTPTEVILLNDWLRDYREAHQGTSPDAATIEKMKQFFSKP